MASLLASSLLRRREALGYFLQNRLDDLPLDSIAALKLLSANSGHPQSVREGVPVDNEGLPLPWLTYPCIAHLEDLDLRGKKVLEFGSGNSTLYWQRRGAEVFSLEFDESWFSRVAAQAGDGVVHLVKDLESATALLRSGPTFDIALIDTQNRLDSARLLLDLQPAINCVLLDNSDWFCEAASFLRASGRVEIRFKGMGPINPFPWASSLFLPADNPLLERLNPQNKVVGGVQHNCR